MEESVQRHGGHSADEEARDEQRRSKQQEDKAATALMGWKRKTTWTGSQIVLQTSWTILLNAQELQNQSKIMEWLHYSLTSTNL